MGHLFLGLDLGQTTDRTAAVILEANGPRETRTYDMRHIELYKLGTSYPDIVRSVQAMLERPQLKGHCMLVIDQTGVGRAIFDMFVEARLQPIGITITPGKNWSKIASDQHNVSKELLVSLTHKLLQTKRIRSSWVVPHSRKLERELRAFKVKTTKSLPVT